MTARYRCPFCGQGSNSVVIARRHLGLIHAAKLFALLREVGYRAIESFSTRKEAITP